MINQVSPAQQSIGPKTLQNIKSNLLAAVRCFLDNNRTRPGRSKLSPSWKRLSLQLPDKRTKNGLSRLIRYCSDNNVDPEIVSDETINTFIEDLENNSFLSTKKRRDIHRRTTRLWNEVSELVPTWPRSRLTVPDYCRPRTTIPISQFPIEFQEEVNRYLDWLEDKDLLAENRPPNRLKPRTLILRRQQIELCSSALVKRGYNIETITSLSSLVDSEAVKEILRFYLDKNDGESNSFMHGLAITLKAIAEHWLQIPETQLAAIKTVKRKLGNQKFGMTENNRRILRQLDDDHNRLLLLELPGQLMKIATGQPDAKAAVTAQKAIAIEILLMAPIRMANLIGLRFDRHLIKPAGSRGLYHLVIPESETKNAEPYEVQLPESLTERIDYYRSRLRPVVCKASNPHLFPDKAEDHKAQSTLSQQIKESISKYTGLELTGHKFRHLCGKLFLEANPGQYEAVRQLLGHKNLKTTVAFYTGINTRESTRVYDDLLLRERERLQSNRKKKRGPA
jgi:integrase